MISHPAYQQTPEGIMHILQLFHNHNLHYLLFKCDHIFQGQNKNLDILFETDQEYHTAAQLLQLYGFIIRLSESIEKYKTMYCGFYNNILYSVHLHRQVAWHGLIALDKKPLFQNAQHLTPLIHIPNLEDSILIHSAHILFENFNITQKEKIYLDQITNPKLNQEYINQQIKKNHWRKAFQTIIKNREKKHPLNNIQIIAFWTNKLLNEPQTAVYFTTKLIKRALRPLTFKRKGNLIALIGVNGSGKSTLTRKLLEHYQPSTTHLGLKQSYYYFGWKPTFPLTSLLSHLLKKNNTKTFQATNLYQKNIPLFSLTQELLFVYLFFEFYYRYRTEIHLLLKKNQLVICDRYFYDIYGQYPYAKNSIIIKPLLKLFPKPDFTYVLDVDEKLLQMRPKTDKNTSQISSIERTLLPLEYLQQQRLNFHVLVSFLKCKIIRTDQDINICTKKIIQDTWRKLV